MGQKQEIEENGRERELVIGWCLSAGTVHSSTQGTQDGPGEREKGGCPAYQTVPGSRQVFEERVAARGETFTPQPVGGSFVYTDSDRRSRATRAEKKRSKCYAGGRSGEEIQLLEALDPLS